MRIISLWGSAWIFTYHGAGLGVAGVVGECSVVLEESLKDGRTVCCFVGVEGWESWVSWLRVKELRVGSAELWPKLQAAKVDAPRSATSWHQNVVDTTNW